MLLLVGACSLVGSSLDPYTASGETDAGMGAGTEGGAGAMGPGDACPANAIVCAGLCLDPTSNKANCGSCGHACATGEACVDRNCVVACPGGQVACDALCYDLKNDPRHCGSCDVACKTGEVCGDEQCSSTCPTGQMNCGGSCADLQNDAKHCGTCDVACGTNQECTGGKCVVACKTQLSQTSITDPWGTSWDGLERATTSWSQARATCEGFGGRLPTASELHRVSATQSASVGQTLHTNALWSIVPTSTTSHVSLRLSDGVTASDADTLNHNYRCVCPPPAPKPYIGGNCNGSPGAGCFALDGENKRKNLDVKDRPAVPKGAAVWECAFAHGRLATPRELTEAIQQGIPASGGAWLHTGDDTTYRTDALLHWTDGVNFTYHHTAGGPNSLTWGYTWDSYGFRCVGENYSPGPHPAAIAGEWLSPTSGRKSDAADRPTATLAGATDACWNKGGHLADGNGLADFLALGLPGGSQEWLWTSDETGYVQGSDFLTSCRAWTGANASAPYVYPTDFDWVYKTATNKHPYRCIYYPVDATFAGPPATACAGGCTAFTLPGTSGAKMWLDNADRTPAVSVTAAIDACRKLGGHLPTARDLTEAIRHNLPNGSGAEVATSDLEVGDGSANGMTVGIVKWTGTQPTFENQYPAGASWLPTQTPGVYRCMWTNELR